MKHGEKIMITEGIVSFCNLKETEKYNGQDTGKYSIVVTMEQEASDKLVAEGVKIKEYKNQPQRKFTTVYEHFPVIDEDDKPTSKNIPYGSKVRIKWKPSDPHPTYGTIPYIQKIRVLELADIGGGADDEEDF